MHLYKQTKWLLLIFACSLIASNALSQSVSEKQGISVSGEVTKAISLKAADISTLKHIHVKAKDKDGAIHTYSGVPLITILEQAGVSLGSQLKGDNLSNFILINAADGYEVLFSLAEVDPEFTDRTILLADKQDGKPLPTGIGPYRIVIPAEKKHARWIRRVVSIQVLSAKQ
ncbi:molybdopterin-dependent oxidoreductase [Rhodocytophaga rosea]|uniref:Molybdopterin-dependent oxidoreductase n=1 Tax=Rhodocytophaga rosea TaxID=2704465 RepID=A0A6C0GSI0_9BACT|nr:molybdopterin-dependent oxidoreductase [Rhodocytophaga rosea]QHT71085.1 molybdopterin-dependent oxidoreductase [Rhodocytophaga rosea]